MSFPTYLSTLPPFFKTGTSAASSASTTSPDSAPRALPAPTPTRDSSYPHPVILTLNSARR